MIQMNLFSKQKYTHGHRKQIWLPKEKRTKGGRSLNTIILFSVTIVFRLDLGLC